ncbi:MAG: EamA family transporter [Thiotrichales bacterium]|nr:EamA family transporter [Thiotrichales bacterium]
MRNPRLLGIACLIGAVSIFTIQDTTIKWLSDVFPLHEIVFIRAAIAALIMLVLIQAEGGIRLLRTARPGLHTLRGLLVVITNSCFFAAIAVMPLADAVAIFFVAPLLITALSTVFLGEHVGVRRWSAIVIGLTGVVVMLRPGNDTVRMVALLPVVAATAYAVLQILTRRLGTTDRASVMAFYVHFAFIVAGALMWLLCGDGQYAVSDNPSVQFLLRAWIVPDPRQAAILLVVGILSAIGAWLLTQAYRVAEATVIAPFEYAALPLAMLWGLIVFGDVPDKQALIGMSLIVGSGLFVLFREAKLKRQGTDT